MKRLNIISSMGINLLIIVLYVRFIWEYHGAAGLVIIYLVSAVVGLIMYLYRKHNVIVELVFGIIALLFCLYSMIVARSYVLAAELLMTMCIVMSITYYYFNYETRVTNDNDDVKPYTFFGIDWNKVDKHLERNKSTDNEGNNTSR